MPQLTVSWTDAKTKMSDIVAEINRTGRPVTVLKNNRPYFVMVPASGTETFASLSEITNPETLAAMREAEDMAADPGHRFYDTMEDFFTALNRDSDV